MSLYGDAIRALRRVILLDERVRDSAVNLARISQEVADLRDRASRLEGMLAAGMALSREANRRSTAAGYLDPPIKPAEVSPVSIRRVRHSGAAPDTPIPGSLERHQLQFNYLGDGPVGEVDRLGGVRIRLCCGCG